jgi:hypothetical protein
LTDLATLPVTLLGGAMDCKEKPFSFIAVTVIQYPATAFCNQETAQRWEQGCQMVYFQAKHPISGKIWRALKWKMLLYFITIRNILRPFGRIYGRFL